MSALAAAAVVFTRSNQEPWKKDVPSWQGLRKTLPLKMLLKNSNSKRKLYVIRGRNILTNESLHAARFV